MSEPTEQDEATEPSVTDVPEPDQDPDEEAAEHEADEADEAASEPAEASSPPVDAAKEQRRIAAALKREHDAHDRKLEKILGEAHEHVLACPLCGDGLQGYVFPGDGQMLDDVQLGQALAFLGLAGDNRLREAEGVVMCDRCDGWGELKYPSRKEGLVTQACPACNGNGYKLATPPASNVTEIAPNVYMQPQPPLGEVGPCPLCGAANSAGKPHFCNPTQATGVGGV